MKLKLILYDSFTLFNNLSFTFNYVRTVLFIDTFVQTESKTFKISKMSKKGIENYQSFYIYLCKIQQYSRLKTICKT